MMLMLTLLFEDSDGFAASFLLFAAVAAAAVLGPFGQALPSHERKGKSRCGDQVTYSQSHKIGHILVIALAVDPAE